jgi:hypothetical protein
MVISGTFTVILSLCKKSSFNSADGLDRPSAHHRPPVVEVQSVPSLFSCVIPYISLSMSLRAQRRVSVTYTFRLRYVLTFLEITEITEFSESTLAVEA